jgi:hypothetical protein
MSITDTLTSAGRTAHDRGAAAVGGPTLDERADEMQRHGVAGQFSMMIRGAVLLAVGVFVVGAIFTAIDLSSGDPLYNASTQVEDLTGQAFEIAPVVLIVLVAVLILTFVRDL